MRIARVGVRPAKMGSLLRITFLPLCRHPAPIRVIVIEKAGENMVALPRTETRARRFPSQPLMAPRLALALALIVCSDIPLFAQFGNPYPGIGFPGGGISLPGVSRRGGNQQNGPTDSVNGKIKRISSSQLVITTDDGRDLNIALDRSTRYYDISGNNAKYGDFDNGDTVSVDAVLDNQNFYHGRRVTMQRKYSPSDSTVSSNSDSGSRNSGSSNDDPDRPVLKRAGGSSGSSSSASSSSSSNNDDPDRPVLRRASSGASPDSADTSSSTVASARTNSRPRYSDDNDSSAISQRPVPREADDPGPPVLRRNAPARVDNTPPAGAGSSDSVSGRPSIKAEDANGVTLRPAPPVIDSGAARSSGDSSETYASSRPPMRRSGDPVIDSARDAAFEFIDTLPNYIVKQYTTRYQTDTAHGNRTSWQALDVVTADVVCENGKESYKNLLINGKAPRDAIEKSGSWSTGEFATILQGILHPSTDADFHNKRSTTIANRAAYRYDYSVEQSRSMWHVTASSESYIPGYTGSIWIDKETYRVLRIEMSAVNMPRSFPLDAVESAVDYDYVLIGEQKHLLPVHSEALSCMRGTAECTRNVIEFRNYKKFTADSSITFGDDK